MNWKDIKTSDDNTHFLFNGIKVFNTEFIEVLKFHAPGIAPVLDETGAYHIDAEGNPLYTERYERTFGFYCNRAAVTSNGDWFHVDVQGNQIYKESYAWTGNFQENICTVRTKEGTYLHINLHSAPCYAQRYNYAGDFKDGIACVKLLSGYWKHIDINGNFINDKSFVDLGVFHKNYATAREENGWFHIDKQGIELYPERYLLVEPFYNGQALATLYDMKKVIIDEKGKTIQNID